MRDKPIYYPTNPGIDMRWDYINTCKHCGAEVWFDGQGRKVIIGGKENCLHEGVE